MRLAILPLPFAPPGPAVGVTVTHLPSPAPAGFLALSAAEIAGARLYVEASRAAGTQRAYADDWRRFSSWCQARGAPALPAAPALLAVYLAGLAAIAVGLRARRAAVRRPCRSEIPVSRTPVQEGWCQRPSLCRPYRLCSGAECRTSVGLGSPSS